MYVSRGSERILPLVKPSAVDGRVGEDIRMATGDEFRKLMFGEGRSKTGSDFGAFGRGDDAAWVALKS